MVISLSNLYRNPGSHVNVDFVAGAEQFEAVSTYPGLILASPAKVSGQLQSVLSHQPLILLKLHVEVTLDASCDRCLKSFLQEMRVDFSHFIVKQESDLDLITSSASETEFIDALASDDRLDLLEILASDLFLNLPAKNLCAENCAGICPGCGVDLNNAHCECQD